MFRIRERLRRHEDGWTWNEGGKWITLGYYVSHFADADPLRYFRVWIGRRRSIEFMISW